MAPGSSGIISLPGPSLAPGAGVDGSIDPWPSPGAGVVGVIVAGVFGPAAGVWLSVSEVSARSESSLPQAPRAAARSSTLLATQRGARTLPLRRTRLTPEAWPRRP
jgi:hypothetical protein